VIFVAGSCAAFRAHQRRRNDADGRVGLVRSALRLLPNA
jgi:hypothetical protein